ncbi:MAG: hypothetical protein GQ574_26625 [Crocinitomix sp.]|nr:hypothetical protein [Crocinitomix sp.]
MNEFLITEYQACISERKDIIHETNNLERNSLIALGIVWTWLYTQSTIHVGIKDIAWFIPFFIIAMSALRVRSLNLILESTEDYLRNLEIELGKADGMFTRYKALRKRKNGRKKKSLIGISAYLYWGLLILVSLVIPLYQILFK